MPTYTGNPIKALFDADEAAAPAKRDPARRTKILAVIAAIWEHHPDMRLGQLLVNFTNQTDFEHNPYFFEDDVLLEQLSHYVREFE
jgi:hypothetical protein